MRKKSAIMLVLLLFAMLIFQGCSSGDPGTAQSGSTEVMSGSDDTGVVMTLEELAKYDGKNGNLAYIAIDGVIYDVTDVPQWSNGDHNGFSAGRDLTNEINNISPHGVSKLKAVPVVGKLKN